MLQSASTKAVQPGSPRAMPPRSGSASISSQPAKPASASLPSSSQPVIVQDRHSSRRYLKGRFLGKGGFAKCYQMTDLETKKIYAGKVVSKATLSKYRAKEKLTTEIKIHKSLKHDNIVGFHRFFEDRENVYILLELCSNQSLMDLHKRRRALSEPEVRYYVKQIIDGTKYMHGQSVIHRDLKLGNLFLNDHMQVRIGDFGLATTVTHEGERKKTLCGTPNYIAPEILDRKNGHSYEVDVWSLGCILYTLLIGRPPFETTNIEHTYRRIQNNDYEIPTTPVISQDAQDLIRQTLHPVPGKRPTMDTILDHPFFTAHFMPETMPTSALTQVPKFYPTAACITSAATSAVKKSKSVAPGTPTRKPLGVLNTDSPATQQQQQQYQQPVALRGGAAATASAVATAAVADSGIKVAKLEGRTSGAVALAAVRLSSATASARPSSMSLDCIQTRLKDVTTRQAAAPSDQRPRPVLPGEAKNGLWISKWVDYSNKYGLGYQISDGTVGVLFNDSTKMMLSPDNHSVEFVDRDARVSNLSLENFPPELHKKVTLLKYFKNYMKEHLLNGGDQAQAAVPGEIAALCHVKKWVRTKHAIVFRLSTGVIQINFFDHTKLIINVPQNLVTFIDKRKATTTYWLEDIATSNHASIHDLASRLFYATDVVSHLVSGSLSGSSA